MQSALTVGEKVRCIRRAYRLTPEEFGRKIGVKGYIVRNWERNLRELTYDECVKIDEVYFVSPLADTLSLRKENKNE